METDLTVDDVIPCIEAVKEFQGYSTCMLLYRGHIDLGLFMDACRSEFGDTLPSLPLDGRVACHGYAKPVPTGDGMILVVKPTRMRGSYPITYVE